MQMAGSFGMGMGMGMPMSMTISPMYGMTTGRDMESSGVFAMGMEGIPLVDIDEPRDVDVLCGRGGASLKHPGNLTYRRLVHMNKGYYISCLKTEKLKISQSIVAAIREQRGRFLERDGNKGTWYDIGDKKAIEKTSQALREGQPKLRQQIVEMGAGNPGMGLEFKVSPPFVPSPMVTPALVMTPAAIQQQIAQQQLAQQRLLAQQRIIQQQMAQQQFAQQQMVRQQLLAQQQTQMQVHLQNKGLPPSIVQGEEDTSLKNIMMGPLAMPKDESGGNTELNVDRDNSNQELNIDVVSTEQHHQNTTSNSLTGVLSELHLNQVNEVTPPQQMQNVYPPHAETVGSAYPSHPSTEMHENPMSHASYRAKTNEDDEERLFPLSVGFSDDSHSKMDPYTNPDHRTEKPPLHQSESQPPGLAHATDSNGNAMRILDRRRIFARMKYSRSPSFGKLNNRSTASLGVDDGMPDIHMVGSTFSLLSNISSNQDMKIDDLNMSSRSVQRLRDDHMVLGSRRSLMSGLSKISDTTDAHSMFSDLSRKFANISTQSIPTSEISGIEEGHQEDLDQSLHVDPVAMANAVHMHFDG